MALIDPFIDWMWKSDIHFIYFILVMNRKIIQFNMSSQNCQICNKTIDHVQQGHLLEKWSIRKK